MPSREERRTTLLRELRTGRRIACYEMFGVAGSQYGARVFELRHNVDGCANPAKPEGVEHGLNIVSHRDPDNSDHTYFVLEPGHWQKNPVLTSRASVRAKNLVADAIAAEDMREALHQPTLFPPQIVT